MNPISVFKVGKPKNEDNEDIIFDKMTDILDENDMDSLMEDEDEDGIDLIYIAVTEEKRKKLVDLFEEYDVLLHHESFTLKQKP
jgi:lipopolysaccharide biosynthesis protein